MGGAPEKEKRFLQHLKPLQGALEAYCRRNVNDPNAVEDVLQCALSNAFRDFHLYVENTNFRAWIFRYVNYEILNWNRRQHPSPQAEVLDEAAPACTWDDVIHEGEWERLLQAPESILGHCSGELTSAIYELPQIERSVLLLRAIGEFRYREIGEILEIPVGSVMGYLGRSRARLRRRLAAFCRDQGLFRIENSSGSEPD